jgi:hypothetical protein
MGTFYSVIRYVPNPIAEERVNIGIVVLADQAPMFRFVQNWRRAYALGGTSVAFLKEFAREAQDRNIGLFPGSTTWDEETLKRVLARWHNSIQFSQPRASLKPADALLEELSELYLRNSPPSSERSTVRGRPYAAAVALRYVRAAVMERFGRAGAQALVAKMSVLKGSLSEHEFDVVLKNGRPLLAANALSFLVPDTMTLRRDVDATAFAMEDVLRKPSELRAGIVVVPPKRRTSYYENTRRMFEKLKVEVVEERKAPAWARSAVGQLPGNILQERASRH